MGLVYQCFDDFDDVDHSHQLRIIGGFKVLYYLDLKLEIQEWAKENEVDYQQFFRCFCFKNKNDAMLFLLTWA
jgi:hypothetical protein